MAKGKKQVVKNVTDFNVAIFDNGFTLNYNGNDSEGDWAEAKVIVADIDKLCELIRGVVELPRE